MVVGGSKVTKAASKIESQWLNWFEIGKLLADQSFAQTLFKKKRWHAYDEMLGEIDVCIQ